jgi:uncharacterized protein (TIGR04255 family)
MAQQRHLTHAPITEAVIDLRVEIREETDASSLNAELIERETGYRRIGPLVAGELGITVDFESGASPEVSQESVRTLGARYHSADDKYVALLSVQGFTFSRLTPYEDWPTLATEAHRIWDVYARSLEPRAVTRVATRFINDLQLPLKDGTTFENYLEGPFGLSDPAFREINGFLLQYSGHDPETEATVRCTQALRPGRHDGILPVVVDIDVYRPHRFSFDDKGFWPYLDRLRDVKNRVFFSLLTEACVDLYK